MEQDAERSVKNESSTVITLRSLGVDERDYTRVTRGMARERGSVAEREAEQHKAMNEESERQITSTSL
ncbi:hypothetical protein VNO78_12455 [Psophocarpus tetragonolobus]|uniref:Uncharacterized protein n=1 Tax=Psophocarpus tetragonolobus TaxID=3891 RepID=A0AAN9XPV8_PSOTE